MTDIAAWSERFDELMQDKPKEGDILTASGGGKAVLHIELLDNAPPFVYGKAYVPEVVGAELGWFLHGEEGAATHGWKCILMSRARTELIAKFGLKNPTVEVKSLRVIRQAQSGKSLLCEVCEY
jgi:hypothetical protein